MNHEEHVAKGIMMQRMPKGNQQSTPAQIRSVWFWLCSGGVYLVAALLTMFVGRGTFTAFLLVFSIILYIGGPVCLFSLLVLGVAYYRQKRRWVMYAKRGLITSLWVCALSLPLWGSKYIATSDVARAKAFCESLLPELQDIRTATGTYPSDISGLTSYTNPPWLLRQYAIYHSDGLQFNFTIRDEKRLFAEWVFSDTQPEWLYFSD